MTAANAFVSMENEYYGVFFWIFVVVNAVSIVIPLSKLIWVFVEDGEEENGFF